MTIPLRQSTASQEIPLGPFLDSTDGNTEETGLTINNTDILLWKHGATTLAAKNSGGATHISNGIYYAVLDATDTNTVGGLDVFVHVAGALAVKVECVVYPANVYDSLIAASDYLQTDVLQWFGGIVATPTFTGVPLVEIQYLDGYAVQSGAGYIKVSTGTGTGQLDLTAGRPGIDWAKVSNPTTSVGLSGTTIGTVTTLTGHTAQTGDSFARLGAPAGASIAADLLTIDNFVDDLESRLTAARAGYLDNLSAGAVALAATALTNATWTDARAGYIDELAAANLPTDIANLNDISSSDVTTACGSAISSATYVSANVEQWGSQLISTPGVPGVPVVDMQYINAGAQSATDLKDFADAGYDPATNKVQGVVLTDTCTTNTDMRGTDSAALAATALTNATWTDARAGYIDELASANLPTDVAAASIRAAVGLASANLDTQLGNIPTNTELATEISDALTVDTIADSYAADGAQPTFAQAILAIHQFMQEKSISGTTLTVKKPDGSSTAMTFTLNSATAPTSITRAT